MFKEGDHKVREGIVIPEVIESCSLFSFRLRSDTKNEAILYLSCGINR